MLTKEEFPSINPDIVKLDELHDLMPWLLNESELARKDHASPLDIKQYDDDFHAAHEQATKLLKRNPGLYKFAQDCGGLVVEGVIQYGDKYQEHKAFVLGENNYPEAEAEYDAVVFRFAGDNSSFVALYGGLFKRKTPTGAGVTAKPTAKKVAKDRRVTPINIQATPLKEQSVAQSFELLHAKELKDLPLDLSPAGQIILRYAAKNPGFLAVELKKLRALKTVYGSDVNNVTKDFAKIRDEIIAGLNDVGVAAKWGFDGQNKGKRYYLLRHTENITAEATPSVPVVKTPPRSKANIVRDQQLIKNAVFAEILLEHIDEQLAKTPDNQMKASDLLRYFVNDLEFTYLDAREILGELYFKEHLFKTRDESGRLVVGRSKIERISPQKAENISAKNVDDKAEKIKEDPAFDFEEVGISLKILDIILGSGRQNRGVRVKTILLNTKIDESVVRSLVNRLAKRRLLNRVPKNPLFLQFPTQKDWDNYKVSKSAYVTPLFEAYNSRVELDS